MQQSLNQISFSLGVKFIIGISFCLLSFFPFTSEAARIYLEPVSKEVNLNDTFLVNIRIDNEGECINAVDVKIAYDNKAIGAVDFSRGESVLTLWVEAPTIDHSAGIISFSGGIPGGYCGRIVGDPGLSNILGKIAFSTSGHRIEGSPGDVAQVEILPSSKVLLNDGLGTPADLTLDGASFTIGTPGKFIKDEWMDEVKKDTIPPELFEINIHQNPSIENNKYFITFTTNDKQSGVDHFEVFEGSWEKPGFEVGTNKPAQWRRVEKNEQYYVLRDQTLNSKVLVKAIDKAGNERLAELNSKDIFQFTGLGSEESFFLSITAVLVVGLLFGIIFHLRKNRRRKTFEEKEKLVNKSDSDEENSFD